MDFVRGGSSPPVGTKFYMTTNNFQTHLNYIKTLEYLSLNLSAIFNFKINTSIKFPIEKYKLINLMHKSLQNDINIINIDNTYANASSIWIPIKAYYLVYHVMTFIFYLESGNTQCLSLGHGQCKKRYKDLLKEEKLELSQDLFNKVYDKSISKYISPSGITIGKFNPDNNEILHSLIMKYIMKKSFEELKKDKKKNKDAVTICIIDYMYIMRIRTNYKNGGFLDEIDSRNISEYCNSYYKFISNFISPFLELCNAYKPSSVASEETVDHLS